MAEQEIKGVVTITTWIDERQVAQSVEIISAEQSLSNIVTEVPIEIGLLGGSAVIKIEVSFDPPLFPIDQSKI